MSKNEYELVTIIRPDLDEASIKAVIAKLEEIIVGEEGIVLLVDNWGARKLAYPIKKHNKGVYVLVSFLSEAPKIDELERLVRLNESIIRFLTAKIADAVDVPVRVEEAKEQRRVKAEEEARRKAEAEERARLEAEARAAAEEARRAYESDINLMNGEAQDEEPSEPPPAEAGA